MIAFIDDDLDLSIILEKNFSNFGDEIKVFNSIDSFKDQKILERVDILCFDIKLGNESGLEYVKSILLDHPTLSLVCFSHYSQLLETELDSLGIRYHVDKKDGIPALKAELMEIIEERELLGLSVA